MDAYNAYTTIVSVAGSLRNILLNSSILYMTKNASEHIYARSVTLADGRCENTCRIRRQAICMHVVMQICAPDKTKVKVKLHSLLLMRICSYDCVAFTAASMLNSTIAESGNWLFRAPLALLMANDNCYWWTLNILSVQCHCQICTVCDMQQTKWWLEWWEICVFPQPSTATKVDKLFMDNLY